jgi:hypothetical protein
VTTSQGSGPFASRNTSPEVTTPEQGYDTDKKPGVEAPRKFQASDDNDSSKENDRWGHGYGDVRFDKDKTIGSRAKKYGSDIANSMIGTFGGIARAASGRG